MLEKVFLRSSSWIFPDVLDALFISLRVLTVLPRYAMYVPTQWSGFQIAIEVSHASAATSG